MAPLDARGGFGTETAGSCEQLETWPKGTRCCLKEKKGSKNLSSMLCHNESQMWYYTEDIFVFVKVQTLARLKKDFSPAAVFINSAIDLYPPTTWPTDGRRLSLVTPQGKCKRKRKLETAALLTNSTDCAYGCSLASNRGTALSFIMVFCSNNSYLLENPACLIYHTCALSKEWSPNQGFCNACNRSATVRSF